MVCFIFENSYFYLNLIFDINIVRILTLFGDDSHELYIILIIYNFNCFKTMNSLAAIWDEVCLCVLFNLLYLYIKEISKYLNAYQIEYLVCHYGVLPSEKEMNFYLINVREIRNKLKEYLQRLIFLSLFWLLRLNWGGILSTLIAIIFTTGWKCVILNYTYFLNNNIFISCLFIIIFD